MDQYGRLILSNGREARDLLVIKFATKMEKCEILIGLLYKDVKIGLFDRSGEEM